MMATALPLRGARYRTEWLWLFAFLLAFSGYLAYSLAQERDHIESTQRDRLAHQATVIEKNLVPQLYAANRALNAIGEDLPRWKADKEGLARANRQLQVFSEALTGIRVLLVVDAAGKITASNNEKLIGKSVAHRQWFQRAASNNIPQTLYLIAPITTLINTYVMGLAHSLSGSRGEFAGAVYASLDPDFAKAQLDSVRYTPDVWAALAHGDGKLFLMAPEREGVIGQDLATPDRLFTRHLDSGETAKVFADVVTLTGEERMTAVRMVQPADLKIDKPLVVAVSRDMQAVFTSWHRELRIQGGLFSALALIAVLSLYLFQRRRSAFDRLADSQSKALRTSSERLNDAQRMAKIGNWSLDVISGELVWSDEVFRIFEIDPARFGATYQAFLDAIHPDDLDAVNQAYSSSLTTQTPYEITHRLKMDDGRIKWVREQCVSEFDATGKPLRSQGTVQDITERKVAAQILEASEAQLSSFFEATPDVMLLVDIHGMIIRANQQVERLLGYGVAELRGESIEILVSDRVREMHSALRAGFAASPDARPMALGRSVQARRKDGSEVDVEISLGRIEAEAGVMFACGLRDITARKQQQEQARQLQMENELILSHALVGLVYLKHRRIVSCNRRLEEIFHYAPGELIGESSELFYDSRETFDQIGEVAYRTVAESKSYSTEVKLRYKDGGVFFGTISGQAVDPTHPDDGSIWIFADITEQKRAEADLRVAAAAFESHEPMIITDANGLILRVNKAFTESTGYTADDLAGQTPRLLKSGRHDTEFYRAMWESIACTGGWKGEIWDRRKNGEVYPKWLSISAVMGADGSVSHYIGTHSDISERKKADEKIHELAFFDQLTGLPNRTLLLDRLKQIRAASSRNDSRGAVLFIDLDNFKTLNDTLGHDMGDLLLRQVAHRLAFCVRVGDTVARLGGDEFVVMLANLSANQLEAATNIEVVAEKIISSLGEPFQLDGVTVLSTASIGITLFSGQLDAIDDLMKQADLAMYKAKDAGRNTFCFFDPAMESAVKERVELEKDLRHALEQKQFLLHYQVQVAHDGSPTGAEVLLRWLHPQRGWVSPAEFIPLAEETGLILPLGHWVLLTACTQLAEWASRPGLADFTIAVNVSARQLRQPDFVDQVLAVLKSTGANPSRLKLELTESLLVHNVQEIINKMKALKGKGVGFSLDDFGTGYSSLSYLKRLPLDQLKIDQSFVRDVLTDANDAAIARTIVALAQSLGLGVIAEGVETTEQQDFLAMSGCLAYQGYLFSMPLPINDFEVFAQNRMCLA